MDSHAHVLEERGGDKLQSNCFAVQSQTAFFGCLNTVHRRECEMASTFTIAATKVTSTGKRDHLNVAHLCGNSAIKQCFSDVKMFEVAIGGQAGNFNGYLSMQVGRIAKEVGQVG